MSTPLTMRALVDHTYAGVDRPAGSTYEIAAHEAQFAAILVLLKHASRVDATADVPAPARVVAGKRK